MTSSRTDRVTGLGAAVAVKAPVLVASTGNIASLSSAQTIDGVATSSGDRVLVWQQTDASENGIYEVATTWGRSKDFDGANEVVRGSAVYVNAGTAYAGNWYRVSSTGNNLPGTDNITFAQASAPTSLTALTGDLNTSGFSIDYSQASITAGTTTNVWSSSGNTVSIGGGSTITSFGLPGQAGLQARTVFTSSGVIVHSTTAIILDSTRNIIYQPGDVADWVADSTALTRLAHYHPVGGRYYPLLQVISTSGVNIPNSGVSYFDENSTSGISGTLLQSVPGSHLEIHFWTSATAITINTTGKKVYTGASGGGGGGTTALSYVSPGDWGDSISLRGVENGHWGVVSISSNISS